MQRTFNFFYAFLLAMLGVGVTLIAEEITLTTYYPAPYGAYDELSTTGNTYLATVAAKKVGIGTIGPAAKLHVYTSPTSSAKLGYFQNASGISYIEVENSAGRWGTWGAGSTGTSIATNGQLSLLAGSSTPGVFDGQGIRIDTAGNVGIGTTSPVALLEVNGNIRASFPSISGGNNLKINTNPGVIGTDLAEFFEASEEVETGDVLIIDETNELKLRKSKSAYEKGVVGVVSSAPAILFEGSQLEIAPQPNGFIKGTKPPIALCGRILCKVSIENGPIKQGDLLTSSSIPGHAMKATDRNKSFGTIVGKALQAFNGGPNGEKEGKIIVLVTLQ